MRVVHATWGVVATKMSEGPPLESLKIRPSQEETSLTNTSHKLCRVTFLFKFNMSIHGVRHPIYWRWCLGEQEARVGWETQKKREP